MNLMTSLHVIFSILVSCAFFIFHTFLFTRVPGGARQDVFPERARQENTLIQCVKAGQPRTVVGARTRLQDSSVVERRFTRSDSVADVRRCLGFRDCGVNRGSVPG